MSQSITINMDQMNGPISIMLPMTTIVLQVPVVHQQHNGSHFISVHCEQNLKIYVQNESNDIKVENINTKEEKFDIKEENINFKEEKFDINEFVFDDEMNQYILHKDENLYESMLSTISNEQFSYEESNKSYISKDQDESYDDFAIDDIDKYFADIDKLITYLKQETMEN